MNSCTISFLPLHNVDDIFPPINLDYFANLLPFVMSSNNLNFIILSDGHGPNIVLLFQHFGKRRRHHLPANVGRCIETPFMVLALVGSHKEIKLHFDRWRFYDGRKREKTDTLLNFVIVVPLSYAFIGCFLYVP
uniref:Uncharacterized protein n=1 Tax=Molossus molossus TaxID=27622 RepID=A0A7J8J0P7_MOLMO|nr:hypothetical protein HJG59_010416 [Molossus molossus]